ncbi:MAG TPA: peptide ABC transporter ATP-binding protein, partial [Chloroflexi bacterium]|nr:peptide ABC transporter ATP-binding protein [Chloroflexota bacterium]
MAETLLRIEDLEVHYATRAGVVKAVDRAGFEMGRGETLGLVGESGCGKSTLGFSILRLVPPPGKIVGGDIIFAGEDLLKKDEEEMRRIRGSRISMIFQDPMTCLDPLQKVGDHIVETITTHDQGIKRAEAWKRAEEML